MTDLYLGLCILALVSFLAYEIGGRVSKRLRPAAVDALFLLTVVGILLYIGSLWNAIVLTRLLPFSNLVVLGNWFPPAAAFLVGLAWHRTDGRRGRVRKTCFLGGLLGVAWFSVVQPLQGQPPECTDSWNGDVCLQTSKFTCSAACAATLLRAHGIPAGEREMAELCLTREGTTWQGLYRGLKHKTAGTEWDVEVFKGTIDDLRRMQSGPIIISARLPESAAETYYAREWGWVPGQSHSVVFFEFTQGQHVRMGEPTFGHETWHVSELDLLWQRTGIRLVRRDEQPSVWATALR